MLYLWMRNIHLALGLACGLVILVYGVSAVQMAHNGWFSIKPTVTEAQITVPAGSVGSARTAARVLMDQHGVRGELRQVVEAPASVRFRIVRPGTIQDVELKRGSSVANVRTSVAGIQGTLNQLHHMAGLAHEWRLLNLWGAFVLIVSLGLFVLGGTGLYLWFKLVKERKLGLVFLIIGVGFGLPLVIALRLA